MGSGMPPGKMERRPVEKEKKNRHRKGELAMEPVEKEKKPAQGKKKNGNRLQDGIRWDLWRRKEKPATVYRMVFEENRGVCSNCSAGGGCRRH